MRAWLVVALVFLLFGCKDKPQPPAPPPDGGPPVKDKAAPVKDKVQPI